MGSKTALIIRIHSQHRCIKGWIVTALYVSLTLQYFVDVSFLIGCIHVKSRQCKGNMQSQERYCKEL